MSATQLTMANKHRKDLLGRLNSLQLSDGSATVNSYSNENHDYDARPPETQAMLRHLISAGYLSGQEATSSLLTDNDIFDLYQAHQRTSDAAGDIGPGDSTAPSDHFSRSRFGSSAYHGQSMASPAVVAGNKATFDLQEAWSMYQDHFGPNQNIVFSDLSFSTNPGGTHPYRPPASTRRRSSGPHVPKVSSNLSKYCKMADEASFDGLSMQQRSFLGGSLVSEPLTEEFGGRGRDHAA